MQVLIFGALVAALFFRAPQVEGRSMLPTIADGSHVVINTLAFRFGRQIARGDVVAFVQGDGEDRQVFLKRVVGLAGERVSLVHGRVKVDGVMLEEPYGPIDDQTNMAPVTVPAGSVYVLGDDRPESNDSRAFGPVPVSSIVGKALFVVWPLAGVRQVR
jgi:signal peptidase I